MTITATPGISVVIPAYGREASLLRAINSVEATDKSGVEIIVVDDASPQSLQLVVPAQNQYGLPVRYYRLARNGGPQAARNLGIRRARFDFVAFLDSDDVFLPEKLDRVRERLARDQCDLLFHAVDGLPTYAWIGDWWDRHGRRFLPFDWLIVLLNPVVTPSLVIRRVGYLGLPRLRHAEDWAFLMRVVRPGMKIGYINVPLARVHRALGSAGGESGARWAMRKGEFLGRAMLLREGGLRNYLRYGAGTLAGSARVVSDVVRMRYRSTHNELRK